MTTETDQLPPQNIEAEKSLLGACLLDSRIIDNAAMIVREEMFYLINNRLLWKAMFSMHNKNQSIDVVTLKQFLEEQGDLEESGGASYLNAVMGTVPYTTHWEYYAKIVRGDWMRRRGVNIAAEMQRAMFDKTQSSEEVISHAERILTELIEGSESGSSVESIEQVLFSVFDELDQEQYEGLLSGIDDLDQITDGFRGNELIILAARPSVGKTALSLNLVEQWCKKGAPILFISAEQSNLELAERLLSLTMGCSMHDLRERKTDTIAEASCANAMSEWNLIIADQANPSILKIESLARLWKRKLGIKAIVVDYLQLVTPSDSKQPREQQVAMISRQLKGIAKSLDIPVIVLAQLNRSVESRGGEGTENHGRPRLSDLRESGSIEQDADKVLFMWRPFKDDPDHEESNLTMIEVAKNRNGPVGKVKLGFNAQSFRFGKFFTASDISNSYIPASWE